MNSRRLLIRTWSPTAAPGVALRDAIGGDSSRRIGGLAVPFGVVTRIRDPLDGEFDEQFQRGAFRRTLGHRTPQLLHEHGHGPTFGRLPVGSFTRLAETRRGLEFDAELFDAMSLDHLLDAVRSGVLRVSIGFRPIKSSIVPASKRSERVPLVTHTEVALPEFSLVTFPAYETTSVGPRHGRTATNDRARRARLAALRAKEYARR